MAIFTEAADAANVTDPTTRTTTTPTSTPVTSSTDPQLASTVQARSYLQDISPDSTVASQLSNLTSQDSSLMQRAREEANRGTGARGFNRQSSIAIGAAQGAITDRMLPIAQQDASTYFKQALANQGEMNVTERSNVEQMNRANLVNAEQENIRANLLNQLESQEGMNTETITGQNERNAAAIRSQELMQQLEINSLFARDALAFGYNTSLTGQQIQGQLARDSAQQLFETNLQLLKGEQSTDLANIDARHKLLLQTNDSAARLYQNNQDAIATILANDALGVTEKTTAIQKIIESMDAGLAVIGAISGLDLRQYGQDPTTGDVTVPPGAYSNIFGTDYSQAIADAIALFGNPASEGEATVDNGDGTTSQVYEITWPDGTIYTINEDTGNIDVTDPPPGPNLPPAGTAIFADPQDPNAYYDPNEQPSPGHVWAYTATGDRYEVPEGYTFPSTNVVDNGDGTSTRTNDDGTTTLLDPANGIETTVLTNGSTEVIYDDGRVVTTALNGIVTSLETDGTYSLAYPGGLIESYDQNGVLTGTVDYSDAVTALDVFNTQGAYEALDPGTQAAMQTALIDYVNTGSVHQNPPAIYYAVDPVNGQYIRHRLPPEVLAPLVTNMNTAWQENIAARTPQQNQDFVDAGGGWFTDPNVSDATLQVLNDSLAQLGDPYALTNPNWQTDATTEIAERRNAGTVSILQHQASTGYLNDPNITDQEKLDYVNQMLGLTPPPPFPTEPYSGTTYNLASTGNTLAATTIPELETELNMLRAQGVITQADQWEAMGWINRGYSESQVFDLVNQKFMGAGQQTTPYLPQDVTAAGNAAVQSMFDAGVSADRISAFNWYRDPAQGRTDQEIVDYANAVLGLAPPPVNEPSYNANTYDFAGLGIPQWTTVADMEAVLLSAAQNFSIQQDDYHELADMVNMGYTDQQILDHANAKFFVPPAQTEFTATNYNDATALWDAELVAGNITARQMQGWINYSTDPFNSDADKAYYANVMLGYVPGPTWSAQYAGPAYNVDANLTAQPPGWTGVEWTNVATAEDQLWSLAQLNQIPMAEFTEFEQWRNSGWTDTQVLDWANQKFFAPDPAASEYTTYNGAYTAMSDANTAGQLTADQWTHMSWIYDNASQAEVIAYANYALNGTVMGLPVSQAAGPNAGDIVPGNAYTATSSAMSAMNTANTANQLTTEQWAAYQNVLVNSSLAYDIIAFANLTLSHG